MGTRGGTRLQCLLAGSVATKVLHEGRGSVMALRGRHGIHGTGKIRVILHPTDFSEASVVALGVACSLAREFGARLVVIHVVPKDLYLEGSMVAEFDPMDYQHTLHGICKASRATPSRTPAETMVRRGHPVKEILRASEDLACDLIIMGTHGFSG